MAELRNDVGALRFAFAVVARERGTAAADEDAATCGGGRLLVSAAVEYLDARDGEWWPIVRLPPARIAAEAVERLLGHQARFLDGSEPGYAWRPDEDAAFALQVGGAAHGAVVEVGLDLGPFLADAGGAPARRDAELALFRLLVTQADLVRFSDALSRELAELPR